MVLFFTEKENTDILSLRTTAIFLYVANFIEEMEFFISKRSHKTATENYISMGFRVGTSIIFIVSVRKHNRKMKSQKSRGRREFKFVFLFYSF